MNDENVFGDVLGDAVDGVDGVDGDVNKICHADFERHAGRHKH